MPVQANVPGFYAEPHLRVQMRCSWFPIGHLPSYGESAHSVRLFQAVLHRAESPAVSLLIPFKREPWIFRVKRSLRLHRRKLRTEIPPGAPAWPRVIPTNRMKYLQASVRGT